MDAPLDAPRSLRLRLCVVCHERKADGRNKTCSTCRHRKVANPKPRKRLLLRRPEDYDGRGVYCCRECAQDNRVVFTGTKGLRTCDPANLYSGRHSPELTQAWKELDQDLSDEDRLYFSVTAHHEERERLGNHYTVPQYTYDGRDTFADMEVERVDGLPRQVPDHRRKIGQGPDA